MKNVNPLNHLRFIWFGGEEIGLLGSKYYVDNLSPSEVSHIGYDLDADVTATPNYTVGVLDPAGPDLFTGTSSQTFPNRVYKASTVARDQMISYFSSIGLNHELFSPVGTDAINFNAVGIPASGVLTGQDCCKTQAEVNLFGGTVGNFEGNISGHSTGDASTTRSGGATTSRTTTRTCSSSCRRGSPTPSFRWPSTTR